MGPVPHRWVSARPLLTSIEVTVTNTCNLRCEHCAVGDQLTDDEERLITLEELYARIDEVDTLLTFSVTGGEPAASQKLVDEVTRPLLQYAKARGLRTQVNTNLTLPLERYESFIEWVDVLHISYNYPEPAEFARIAYAYALHQPKDPEALLRRMDANIQALAAQGVFVSAETLLTHATLPKIDVIHARIADLGCVRHEIHPLYPSDFARHMQLASLDELAGGVRRLLARRDPAVWILFGTFPFFACSPDPSHRELWQYVMSQPNTTIRNDPDGRNRLNVSSLTGDVLVADFADLGPLGNIRERELYDDLGAMARLGPRRALPLPLPAGPVSRAQSAGGRKLLPRRRLEDAKGSRLGLRRVFGRESAAG